MGLIVTREAILEKDDRTAQEVEVPEWGGSVRIRKWNLSERMAFSEAMEKQQSEKAGMDEPMALAVALSVVDKEGNRLFSEKDVVLIKRKSGTALEHIFREVMELNKASAKEVGEIAKN